MQRASRAWRNTRGRRVLQIPARRLAAVGVGRIRGRLRIGLIAFLVGWLPHVLGVLVHSGLDPARWARLTGLLSRFGGLRTFPVVRIFGCVDALFRPLLVHG